MRLPIRPLAATALAVVAVFLSGCFEIQSETTRQLTVIGDVEIATTTCTFVMGGPPPGITSCPGNSGGPAPGTNYLIAYRIQNGVVAPPKFKQASGDPVSFKLDTTYSDSLTTFAPPPAGEHWVGYRSTVNPSPANSTFKPAFTLPQSNGKPFQGPFKYRTVTGFIYDNSPLKDEPVVCANPPTTQGPSNVVNNSFSFCIDSPDPTAYQTDQDVPTRDLGVTSTGDGSVRQNESGALPFSAEFAGTADPSASFQLSGSTNAPGVTLTPSPATFAPATDSTTALSLKADVAPTTPAGTYDVALVASLPNGLQRRATGKLTVALGKPVNLRIPEITGTAAVGNTVTCNNGDWSSSPTTFTYKWSRAGTEIAGATAQTYLLTQPEGATLVTCTATAGNAVGTGGTATSGAVRMSQAGGADVDLSGKPTVSRNANGTYTVDPGITVSCPARLPINCGGANHVDANADTTTSRRRGAAARRIEVASAGFTAPTGKSQKLILRLSHRGSNLLDRQKKLTLVVRVVTRNHLLKPVTSTKRFTIRRPG
jgi:hypothetical protein